jgi:hypothetical protein
MFISISKSELHLQKWFMHYIQSDLSISYVNLIYTWQSHILRCILSAVAADDMFSITTQQ